MKSRGIYISGPITGQVEQARQAFKEAQDRIERTLLILPVINPFEITKNLGEHVNEPRWEDYMRVCIHYMVRCEAIVMLPGWEKSRGARLEHSIAKELGLVVIDWSDCD